MGTKYTSYTATKSVTNGMLEGVEAVEFTGEPTQDVDITGGYFWIVANAKKAFEGILEDPNDALNWDKVAKAYCDVVKMYCAYRPYCEDDGCRPQDIIQEYNYFCVEGPEGDDTNTAKFRACNHLDYVNGPQ